MKHDQEETRKFLITFAAWLRKPEGRRALKVYSDHERCDVSLSKELMRLFRDLHTA